MTYEEIDQNDNQVDLKGLFSKLWACKAIIFTITVISIILSYVYMTNLQYKYRSVVIFKFENPQNSSSSYSALGDALGGIQSLIGTSGPGDKLRSLIERSSSRVFIESMDKELDFKSDRFFNSYDHLAIEPVWKSKIKKIIGYSSNTYDESEMIWRSILNVYKKNIIFDLTPAKSIIIEVFHVDPSRSAEIANHLMQSIIIDFSKKENIEKKTQLDYLSTTVATALYDLEEAEKQLKSFAINKSAMPVEAFATASLELDVLKDKNDYTQKLFNAIQALKKITDQNTQTYSEYVSLKKVHPIIDRIDFRRIFGLSEKISNWSWPDSLMVSSILQSVGDRKNDLQNVLIKKMQQAEQLKLDVDKYAELTREQKVLEASYSILMEQIKASSLINGLTKSTSEILEYAAEPVIPSSPSRQVILTIGALLGLFTGSLIGLLINKSRGVYVSNYLLLGSQKKYVYSYKSKYFRKFSRKSLKEINIIKNKYFLRSIRDLKLELINSKKQIITITEQGSKLRASELARILGVSRQSDGVRIVFIDFSCTGIEEKKEKELVIKNQFMLIEEFGNLNILLPVKSKNALDFLTRKDSKELLEVLKNKYDEIIFTSNNKDALTLARFLTDVDPFHITLTRKNKTKSNMFMNICKTLPLGAQIYD